MGPGNLLGLEDIARISPHSYSAKCISQTGTILKIDTEKLNGVVKVIHNGFSEIAKMNKAQWKSFYDKLTVLEEQKNQIKGMQNKLIADNKSDNNFSKMDFFKALFFKVKLNPKKMQRIFDEKE